MGTLFLIRDWDATLKLHFEKPTLFPEVTFENSPVQVELKLI